MDTRISEIADGIYRLSTFVSDVGPTGFTFNQYLIDDEQPLLFHTGHRAHVPARCRRRSRRSRRSRTCAGSRSVTSRPTSAGR